MPIFDPPLTPYPVPPHCEPTVPCAPILTCPCVTCDNLGRDVEMACLTDIIKHVLPAVTYKESTERMAAPENSIVQAITETVFDFTKKSRLLERRAVIKTQREVLDYYIEPLADEQINLIKSICVDGICIEFANGRCCDDRCAAYYQQFFGCSDIGYMPMMGTYAFEPPNKIVLTEPPVTDDLKIIVKYYAMSTQTACNVDKLVFDRYLDAIVSGAQARLLTLPAWEWTAPSFGLNAERKYQMKLAEAALDVTRGFAVHKQTATPFRRY